MLTPERQWHTSVVLDDFVNQVDEFVRIVFLTVTSQLSEFTEDTMRIATGWGSYIEQVINSLSTDWQREMLVQALASSSKCKPWLQIATLSRLRQARRWVLSSTLGSAFLDHHPEPRAVLKWTMAEYAALLNDDESKQESADLSVFLVDATDVMRSSAYTAVLSHAYLALVVCTNEETRVGKGHAPSASEMSVETAQKRAYASNCWNVLLRMREQRRATDFIANMATLARTDTLVMEVMCYTLIEPCKTITCIDRGDLNGWVHGARPDGHQQERVSHLILKQVLTFRDDSRLWALDAWLLAEVSHNYLAFADAYLAHLLGYLLESKVEERDLGIANEAPAMDSVTSSQLKDVKARLRRLSSRSRRLRTLCRTALGQSNLASTYKSA